MNTEKTVNNTDANGASKQVKDIEFWGNGDTFKLIYKASSKAEGWMKSTRALDVGNGCVVQVTTQQGDQFAEALTFVPGVTIIDEIDLESGEVQGRHLEPIDHIENATESLASSYKELREFAKKAMESK